MPITSPWTAKRTDDLSGHAENEGEGGSGSTGFHCLSKKLRHYIYLGLVAVVSLNRMADGCLSATQESTSIEE